MIWTNKRKYFERRLLCETKVKNSNETSSSRINNYPNNLNQFLSSYLGNSLFLSTDDIQISFEIVDFILWNFVLFFWFCVLFNGSSRKKWWKISAVVTSFSNDAQVIETHRNTECIYLIFQFPIFFLGKCLTPFYYTGLCIGRYIKEVPDWLKWISGKLSIHSLKLSRESCFTLLLICRTT